MSRTHDLLRTFLIPHWLEGALRFRKEKALLVGGCDERRSDEPSVAFFTTHKCASVFTPKALAYLNRKYLGLQPVDLASYFYHASSEPTWEHYRRRAPDVVCGRGFLYAPLREYVPLPTSDDMRVLVMVRDPRDMMTSHYYSVTRVHTLPAHPIRRRAYRQRRRELSGLSVDEWVERRLDATVKLYSDYARLCRERTIVPLRYEDMILDFVEWVRQLGVGLGIETDTADVEKLRTLGRFGAAPSANSHIRQREPGEHRTKLAEETVSRLNESLGPALDFFGYDR